ncbi:hypothetical protein MHYP_G00090170 [Metynnis hypsauchen]
MGDWNCSLDFTRDRNGEEPHPQAASALATVISTFTLTDVWQEKCPTVKQHTGVDVPAERVFAAGLDRLYVSHNVRRRNRVDLLHLRSQKSPT